MNVIIILFSPFLGSLSNNDGDVYENVTSVKLKVNSRYFQLYRAYSNSFNSSNVGKFCCKRLYQRSGKEILKLINNS